MTALAFMLKQPKLLTAAGYIAGPASLDTLDGDSQADALSILQMRG